MNLRLAIFLSVLLHLGLMILRPPPSFVPPRELLHPFEVSYLPIAQAVEQPRQLDPRRASPGSPTSTARFASAVDLPPTGGVSTNAGAIPRPAAAELPKPKPLEVQQDLPSLPTPTAHLSPDVDLPVIEEASAISLPEGEFASIEHKQWVRQHLKAHLHYPSNRMNGTVRLQLVLAPHGVLKEIAVLEASDPRLADLAVKDAQAAVPYPRFPKEMKQRQVRYEFLVKYQPE